MLDTLEGFIADDLNVSIAYWIGSFGCINNYVVCL